MVLLSRERVKQLPPSRTRTASIRQDPLFHRYQRAKRKIALSRNREAKTPLIRRPRNSCGASAEAIRGGQLAYLKVPRIPHSVKSTSSSTFEECSWSPSAAKTSSSSGGRPVSRFAPAEFMATSAIAVEQALRTTPPKPPSRRRPRRGRRPEMSAAALAIEPSFVEMPSGQSRPRL